MVPHPETNVPTLVDTNARVLRWRPESGSRIGFELSGHEPIALTVRSHTICRVNLPSGATVRGARQGAIQTFHLKEDATGDAALVCQ